jgi:hypothetical protein
MVRIEFCMDLRRQISTPCKPREVLMHDVLRSGPAATLNGVSCELQDGVLTLRGRLPSYYLKQLAQAAGTQIAGVKRVESHIEVVQVRKERES